MVLIHVDHTLQVSTNMHVHVEVDQSDNDVMDVVHQICILQMALTKPERRAR